MLTSGAKSSMRSPTTAMRSGFAPRTALAIACELRAGRVRPDVRVADLRNAKSLERFGKRGKRDGERGDDEPSRPA